MAVEIASAYISLIPTFRGVKGKLQDEIDPAVEGPAEDSGRKFGEKFSGAFGTVLKAGGLLVGLDVLKTAFDQAITSADLPGALQSQFALSEDAAAAAAQSAGDVYAAGFGESLEQVGAAAGTAKRALDQLGDSSDLTAITTQAQALADKFGEDVADNISAASQLVKTGLAPDMDSAMDILAAGFTKGSDAGHDLLDTITEYSVQFQALGLSGADALGLINQSMAAGARNSDVAADALKEFNLRAVALDANASAAFQSLGLNASEMQAAIAGGGESAKAALDQTLDALRGIEDPATRSAVAVGLFGTKAEDLDESLLAMDPSTAAEGLGEVADAADKLTGTESAARSIDSLGRSITDSLASAITPIIPLLSGFLDFLKPITPILGPLALGIGLIVAAQWAWNAAMAASPLTWIVAAIAAVVVAVALAIAYWDEIVAALKAAWEWIADVGVAIWESVADFFSGIWSGIVDAWNAAWSAVTDWLVGSWQKTSDHAIEIWNSIVEFFVGIWDWIVEAWNATWTGIMTALQVIWDLIVAYATTVWTGFIAFFVGLGQQIWSIIVGAWNLVWGAIQTVWGLITDGVSAWVDTVIAYVSFLASLPGMAWDWFMGILDSAVSAGGELLDWAGSLPGEILDSLGNIASYLLDAGSDLINGLLQGMKNAAGAVYDWISGMLANVWDQVVDFFDIASPSRKMKWAGRMVVSGLGDGMDDELPSVTAAADRLTTAATPDLALTSTGLATLDTGPRLTRADAELIADVLTAVPITTSVQVDSAEIARATDRGSRVMARRA